jgi:hypothetical protein
MRTKRPGAAATTGSGSDWRAGSGCRGRRRRGRCRYRPLSLCLTQAGLPRADRPGTPALLRQDLLGDGDLGGLTGLMGKALAAVVVPGGGVELQAAVIAVAGVGVPVPAGLAGGDLVPVAGRGGGVGQRRRGRRGGRARGGGVRGVGRRAVGAADRVGGAAEGDQDAQGEGGDDGYPQQPAAARRNSGGWGMQNGSPRSVVGAVRSALGNLNENYDTATSPSRKDNATAQRESRRVARHNYTCVILSF